MGHRDVKAALAATLGELLPGYFEHAVWVGVGDALPVDTVRWPFALVRTTSRTASRKLDERTVRADYRCEITVGVRSEQPGEDEARIESTNGRDDLVDAVHHILRWSPGLGQQIRVNPTEQASKTAPSVREKSGQTIAVGTITFSVTATEPVVAPDGSAPAPVADSVEVTTHSYPIDTATLDPEENT